MLEIVFQDPVYQEEPPPEIHQGDFVRYLGGQGRKMSKAVKSFIKLTMLFDFASMLQRLCNDLFFNSGLPWWFYILGAVYEERPAQLWSFCRTSDFAEKHTWRSVTICSNHAGESISMHGDGMMQSGPETFEVWSPRLFELFVWKHSRPLSIWYFIYRCSDFVWFLYSVILFVDACRCWY